MNIGKLVPIELTNKTAYLTGVIIGDGHISNSSKSKTDKSVDYRIVIDLIDKKYSFYISKLVKSIIHTKSVSKPIIPKPNRAQRFVFQFRNKSFFYFLTKDLDIPNGSKSSLVQVPKKIKSSSNEIKKHFVAGLFDTDGGFRGKTLGFTSASEDLMNGISLLFIEFLIGHSLETWINKQYERNYFGLRIKKSEIDNFLKNFPLQNKEKLIRIYKRFSCGDAGVAKRDR